MKPGVVFLTGWTCKSLLFVTTSVNTKATQIPFKARQT
jgi:hypothetical protein